MSSKDLEIDILDKITKIHKRRSELIQPGLKVNKEYGISRSFGRDSNLKAQNLGVKDDDIVTIFDEGRWGTRNTKLRMNNHYIDVLLSLESFLRNLKTL